MTDGRPLDPVARFHLGNGARLLSLAPTADSQRPRGCSAPSGSWRTTATRPRTWRRTARAFGGDSPSSGDAVAALLEVSDASPNRSRRRTGATGPWRSAASLAGSPATPDRWPVTGDPHMRQRSLLFLPLLAVAALLLGACGDDSADDTTTTAAPTPAVQRRDSASTGSPCQRRSADRLLRHALRAVRVRGGRRDQGIRLRRRLGHGRPAGASSRVRHHAVRLDHPGCRRRQLRHDRLGDDHHR